MTHPSPPFFPDIHTFVRIIAVGILCLGLINPAGTQVLPFHSYSTKEGLISNTITALHQDAKGYIWIATYDGVSMYDGRSFRNFTTADGLAHNLVWCIGESRRMPGTVLFGTRKGISVFDGRTMRTRDVSPIADDNAVLQIIEDANDNFWLLTPQGIIIVRDDSALTTVMNGDTALTSNLVLCPDNTVAFANGDHIIRYDRTYKSLTAFLVPQQYAGNIWSLAVDANNDFWCGSRDSTILHYSSDRLVAERKVPAGMPGGLLVDRHGILWAALYHDGMARVPTQNFTRDPIDHLNDANGLHDADITALIEDREGSIWIGGFRHGVLKLAEQRVMRFQIGARSVFASGYFGSDVDTSGHFWAGETNAIREIWKDRTGWHDVEHDMQGATDLTSVAVDHDANMLWVATGSGRLLQFSITRHAGDTGLSLKHTLRPEGRVPEGTLFAVMSVREGRLWYVKAPDVGVMDISGAPTLLRKFSFPGDLPIQAPRAVSIDHLKNVWLGGFGEGVAMLPGGDLGGTMKLYTTADGLPDNAIRSIAEDEGGALWVGTRYGGFARFDGTRFHSFTTGDGLMSNCVWGITPDRYGILRLCTSLGVQSFDSRTGTFSSNPELIGSNVWACRMDPGHALWFVTADGILRFDAGIADDIPTPPLVNISDITVNGTRLEPDDLARLSHLQNTVIIQFDGLSFRSESANRFRYRLRELDTAWSAPTNARSVTFAALNPDSYTFQVTAYNGDGVASAAPASVSFIILPPFWQRWWFVGGSALFLLAAFGFTVRYVSTQRLQRRVQELEKQRAVQLERERTRERIARDLHDDVASTLGSVVIYSESLRQHLRDNLSPTDLVDRISSLSLEAQESIADIVWATSPTHDSLSELLIRISDVASATCSVRGMRYDISVPSEIPHRVLSDEVRKSLLLIFKESMNNIVKHANAESVQVSVELDGNTFRMTIADNGTGFEENGRKTSKRGHGLRNMKKRAEEIGATLNVDSTPGKGTTIRVSHSMT